MNETLQGDLHELYNKSQFGGTGYKSPALEERTCGRFSELLFNPVTKNSLPVTSCKDASVLVNRFTYLLSVYYFPFTFKTTFIAVLPSSLPPSKKKINKN